MSPLSIIGSVAGVAGVAAISFGAMQAFYGFVGMIEAREGYRIQVETAKVTAQYEKKIADKANEVRDREGRREKEFSLEKTAMMERLDERDKALRNQMLNDPSAASFEHFRDIYVGMCKQAAADNNEAREACVLRAGQSDPSGRSPLMAVTPDTFGEGGIVTRLCEETGADEYCKYQFVGINLTALKELKGWMGDIDRYTRALRDQKRGMAEQMEVAATLDEIIVQPMGK